MSEQARPQKIKYLEINTAENIDSQPLPRHKGTATFNIYSELIVTNMTSFFFFLKLNSISIF